MILLLLKEEHAFFEYRQIVILPISCIICIVLYHVFSTIATINLPFLLFEVNIHIYIYIYTYIYIYIHIHICIHIHIYIYIQTHTHTHTHIHIYIYICIQVCMSLYIYQYIYKHCYFRCSVYCIMQWQGHITLLSRQWCYFTSVSAVLNVFIQL